MEMIKMYWTYVTEPYVMAWQTRRTIFTSLRQFILRCRLDMLQYNTVLKRKANDYVVLCVQQYTRPKVECGAAGIPTKMEYDPM